MTLKKLDRSFYLRDTVTVAKDLLGKRLVHQVDGHRLVAEITETEAYTGIRDRACHAYGGRRTPRTETLYLPGGHAYIYFVYGMHHLFNAVTEAEGSPCAVLVRGGRVLEGRDQVARRRTGKDYRELTPKQQSTLLQGPGRFCSGMWLTRDQNTLDLLGDALYLCEGESPAPSAIGAGTRVGVDYAGEDALLPYRFFIREG